MTRPQRFLRIDYVNDFVHDAVEVFKDVSVVKTQNTNAFFIKLDLAIQVGSFADVTRMPGAIEFNRELGLRTKEIDHSIADTVLPPKFQAGCFPIAET